MHTKDAPVSYSKTILSSLFDTTLEFSKKNLNQFITQKYNSRNSNPIVLLYLWETFHKYYSLKAKAQYCILHYDLYKRNISDSQYCLCGHNSDP